jgi:hypothetical protein
MARRVISSTGFRSIIPALKAVCAGQSVFGEDIVAKNPEPDKRSNKADLSEYGLTDKEADIIRLIAGGLSNKELPAPSISARSQCATPTASSWTSSASNVGHSWRFFTTKIFRNEKKPSDPGFFSLKILIFTDQERLLQWAAPPESEEGRVVLKQESIRAR